MNFNLWKHHGLAYDIIENMLPFERDVNTMLLKEWLEEEKKRQKQQQQSAG